MRGPNFVTVAQVRAGLAEIGARHKVCLYLAGENHGMVEAKLVVGVWGWLLGRHRRARSEIKRRVHDHGRIGIVWMYDTAVCWRTPLNEAEARRVC